MLLVEDTLWRDDETHGCSVLRGGRRNGSCTRMDFKDQALLVESLSTNLIFAHILSTPTAQGQCLYNLALVIIETVRRDKLVAYGISL